jgi:hypothetical protein
MKKWTVMVYMAGDNDLDKFGKEDLDEMCQLGSSSEFNVVVQFDREGKDLQTKRYEITPARKGKAEARVVEMLGETNTGDPKVLEDFIQWGVEKYGAEHYMLVLWNHGRGFKDYDIFERSRVDGGYVKALREHRYYGGWLNKFMAVMRKALFVHPALLKDLLPGKDELLRGTAQGRAVCIDAYVRDFIDCQELRKTLERAYKKTGKMIDIMGFDACLMNMMEVLCQVKDYAGFVVGSEETEPGKGWPYHLVLKILQEEPGITPEMLSKKMVGEFREYYKPRRVFWPVTQSAVKTEKLGELCAAVYEFAGALKRIVESSALNVDRILLAVQRYDDRDYADLGDFVYLCKLILPKLSGECDRVHEALRAAVVEEAHWGKEMMHSWGVSIFIPESRASLEKNRESYMKLELNKADRRWVELLDEVRPDRERALERMARVRVEEESARARVM